MQVCLGKFQVARGEEIGSSSESVGGNENALGKMPP